MKTTWHGSVTMCDLHPASPCTWQFGKTGIFLVFQAGDMLTLLPSCPGGMKPLDTCKLRY